MHLGRVWLICEHINAINIDIIKFERLNVNYISSNHFYIVFEVELPMCAHFLFDRGTFSIFPVAFKS